MSSLRRLARCGRSLAGELEFRPYKDMYFSWSGIDLAVELGIGEDSTKTRGNCEIAARNRFARPVSEKSCNFQDATNEPGSKRESRTTPQDTDVFFEQSGCPQDFTSEPVSIEESSSVLQVTGLVIEQREDQKDTTNEPGSTGESRKGNDEIVGQSSLAVDHLIEQSQVPDDATIEHCITQESSNLQQFASHENGERDADEHPGKVDEKCGPGARPQDVTCSFCTWPDWGEPLPPEDIDDDVELLESDSEVKRSHSSKKVVTFSDAVTFVEPSGLQEERETGSFSYLGSSDDEVEQGTDQVTSSNFGTSCDLSSAPVSSSSVKEILDSADVSAACHLLELGSSLNCGGPEQNGSDSSGGFASKGDFYDPSEDLERLSELVEELFASLPQPSIVSDSQGSFSSQKIGHWSITVSEDSGRIRMKRIKREEAAECKLGLLGIPDFEDENEVLERPPWKRQYKSIGRLPWQGQVSVH